MTFEELLEEIRIERKLMETTVHELVAFNRRIPTLAP